MGLLQRITEFFKSITSPSSPENIQRQAVRRIEANLRMIAPSLYKGGMIQPNFAEALRVLFFNTAPIHDILSSTFCSSNLDDRRRFGEHLLLTGFDSEAIEIIEGLNYEKRKQGAMEADSLSQYFEKEHRQLEKVVQQLNSPKFVKIGVVFNKLNQLNDICRFGYMTVLRLFDPDFSSNEDYKPNFQPCAPELIDNSLCDLYFVVVDMDITISLYNATLALFRLKNGESASEREAQNLKENFKKIQSIIKHILTRDVLLDLIRISKKNSEFIPERAVYNENSRQKYADHLESMFRVDESRLKTEIQDTTIKDEVGKLFSGIPLVQIQGYSKEIDAILRQSTEFSFMWVMPLQFLKNFVISFYEEHIKAILNDIVIEGFFNNPAYKTEFSTHVFTCNEMLDRISAFEEMFGRGKEFDEANINSLVVDSHKDPAFENTLKNLVTKINSTAKELLQNETTNIFNLYKNISDLMIESKKPASELITNLKFLMISSRNRENADIMESQAGKWKVFLEIMKNYVIIGNLEKK